MNDANALPATSPFDHQGPGFQVVDWELTGMIHTFLVRNVSSGKHLFISVLEETERYALVELWEEGKSLGLLPILKDEEFNRAVGTGPGAAIAAFIWQHYQDAQASLQMLRRKLINHSDRYSSKLNLIARSAAIVLANTIADRFLFLARKGNRDAAGLAEWEASGSRPEWLNRASRILHLLILREFDSDPHEAEAVCLDYWRSVAGFAWRDLKAQGRIENEDKRGLKATLNRHVFDNEEFDGSTKAIGLCARAWAIKETVRSDVFGKSIETWDQLLAIKKSVTSDRRCKPSNLVFEQEPILPYGVVEEKVRMSWQKPLGSDLEILHGGVHADLILPMKELLERGKEAVKLWQNRKKIWREAGARLDDPEYCLSFYRWVISERRRIHRYVRARYGIDMAHRRILRQAVAPRTAEETADRALWYAEAMAMEAATEAGHFTAVWYRDEMREAGHEGRAVWEKAIKEAAKATLGVLEAFPLFHMAILSRTSNPAVRAVEIQFLCGIGAEIGWRKFPSLNKALSMQEGTQLSWKETQRRFIEQLPQAVLHAVKGRQIGEPLVNGRNSFRNKVVQYFRKQDDSKPHRDSARSDSLEKIATKRQSTGIRRLAAEDHMLVEEVRAKIAKQIARSHLSPQQQAIMELKLLENKSQNEIAVQLAMSVNQVKCQQSRAFKKAPALRDYAKTLVS